MDTQIEQLISKVGGDVADVKNDNDRMIVNLTEYQELIEQKTDLIRDGAIDTQAEQVAILVKYQETLTMLIQRIEMHNSTLNSLETVLSIVEAIA